MEKKETKNRKGRKKLDSTLKTNKFIFNGYDLHHCSSAVLTKLCERMTYNLLGEVVFVIWLGDQYCYIYRNISFKYYIRLYKQFLSRTNSISL